MVVAGKMDYKLFKAFSALDIYIIELEKNCKLHSCVDSHADMLCHYLGEGSILLSKEDHKACSQLENLGFNVSLIEKPLLSDYPDDIALNCARIGDKLFCKLDSTASEVLNYCRDNDIETINIRQGYARCSTCIVNEKAVITEDLSIKKACDNNGIDALVIERGFVELPGYDCGFIGGCCALISQNELAFFGDIEKHPDFYKINAFLSKHNVIPVSLVEGGLMDIGGIVPILEEDFGE
jgi:hypothetical protein